MQTTLIPTKAEYLNRNSNGLAHSILHCPDCGRDHRVPIGEMRAEPGLVAEISSTAARILGHAPRTLQVVYDRQIAGLINRQVISPLRSEGLHILELPLGEEGHLLDSEHDLGDQASELVDPAAEILVGAGSGVICDLTKWIATRKNIPYIVVGTAPSMNAYTSITATITENDVKISRLLNPPDAVLLDIDILREAPAIMIHAGMGDLAARAICSADWKLAQLIQGTSFCPLPYEMTAANEKAFLEAAEGIGARDPQAIQLLSEAILMSGLSMTVLEGETSPSSGAEHVISHFWDLLTHTRGLKKNLHGYQVGVGTVIMLAFYELMREIDVMKIDPARVIQRRASIETLIAENNAAYGIAAPLFNEVVRKKYLTDQELTARIHWVQANWDKIWEEVTPYAASLNSIRTPLQKAGMQLTLSAVHRTREDALEALVKGPQYRSRYTVLDLAWELGLMPELAETALVRSGVLG